MSFIHIFFIEIFKIEIDLHIALILFEEIIFQADQVIGLEGGRYHRGAII